MCLMDWGHLLIPFLYVSLHGLNMSICTISGQPWASHSYAHNSPRDPCSTSPVTSHILTDIDWYFQMVISVKSSIMTVLFCCLVCVLPRSDGGLVGGCISHATRPKGEIYKELRFRGVYVEHARHWAISPAAEGVFEAHDERSSE